MKKLAIIGSGIAGMGCAYFLDNKYDITVFDKNNYIGGHTNTIEVNQGGKFIPIDTGFMVFNKVTYPNLIQFFKELNVPYQKTDMSFSVHDEKTNIEWNGAGLNKIFSQRRNILNPEFWAFINEMKRFSDEAAVVVDNDHYREMTIAEFFKHHQYSNNFANWFLVPMGSAIWSTNTSQMLSFPIQTMLRFFLNHGFLGLDTHYQWYTVTGGSQQYVTKLKEKLSANFKASQGVNHIRQTEAGVEVLCDNQVHIFDKVIVACHADEALALLEHPTQLERDILGSFAYEANSAILHSDISVMPQRKRCWAAWNYRLGESDQHKTHAAVHYWMNRLQNVSKSQSYFVSLNAEADIDPAKIHKKMNYTHPVFDGRAIQAQETIETINTQSSDQTVFFCGSYFKYGFHEDAFTSALGLSKQLGGNIPWQ